MSAMSAESKTSPPTKHTALSVAKTPDDDHHHQASPFHSKLLPKSSAIDRTQSTQPISQQYKWTPAQESTLRALVGDYAKLWSNGHHEEFWRMLHADMVKDFGSSFDATANTEHNASSQERFPAERWVWERQPLRDFLGLTHPSPPPPGPVNGVANHNGEVMPNGHARQPNTPILPDMGSFRKKRKMVDGQGGLEDIVTNGINNGVRNGINGVHVNGDGPNPVPEPPSAAPVEPNSAAPAANGTKTLPLPADGIKNEDVMQTGEDATGLPDAMASILNSTATTAPRMSQIYEQIEYYLRESGLSEPPADGATASSGDVVVDSYDVAFNTIKRQLDSFGRAEGGLAVLIMMTYRLVRDNRTRVLAAADENEKEQKKRKWNDDVLWSMINDKCAQVGLRAGEDLTRLARLVEEKMPKMRDDIMQALAGPSLPQMQYIDPTVLDCQLTRADDPPMVKHSRSQSMKNGYRDYATLGAGSLHDRGRAAEVDTTVLVQKMQKLMEQREADAKLIEQQKLVILQMDRRLQYLESRIASVA